MKKEQKIINGFIKEINHYGIGDLWVSAERNGDEFNVEIASAHDVSHRKEDIYNNFTGYCEQYFSSQEWMEFLDGESTDFSSKYSDIIEEMDYDYHDTFLYNSLFVIKHDIEQAFQRYIDTHFEDVEDDFDEEEDALPTLEMFANDYYFSINVKTTSVFSSEWLLNKFNEDRKLKYGKEAAAYIAEYLETLVQQRNDGRNLIITDVRSDLGFINITSGMYSDKNLDNSINYFIKNLYNSKDFEKLVKGGIFGSKLMKIVNKWNDMIYVKVLDSETWSDYKLDLNDDFRKHTEQLYSRGEINQDVRREMLLTEIRVNLEYVYVIKEDELYYRVYEAREKAKKNKK